MVKRTVPPVCVAPSRLRATRNTTLRTRLPSPLTFVTATRTFVVFARRAQPFDRAVTFRPPTFARKIRAPAPERGACVRPIRTCATP